MEKQKSDWEKRLERINEKRQNLIRNLTQIEQQNKDNARKWGENTLSSTFGELRVALEKQRGIEKVNCDVKNVFRAVLRFTVIDISTPCAIAYEAHLNPSLAGIIFQTKLVVKDKIWKETECKNITNLTETHVIDDFLTKFDDWVESLDKK